MRLNLTTSTSLQPRLFPPLTSTLSSLLLMFASMVFRIVVGSFSTHISAVLKPAAAIVHGGLAGYMLSIQGRHWCAGASFFWEFMASALLQGFQQKKAFSQEVRRLCYILSITHINITSSLPTVWGLKLQVLVQQDTCPCLFFLGGCYTLPV
jgi:hypothetical protein